MDRRSGIENAWRRRLFVLAIATSMVACGLGLEGLGRSPTEEPDANAVDGASDTATPGDGSATDGGADAPFDCGDGGGGFCDLCDESLLLCFDFEDSTKDESRYKHALIVLGQLGFVNGPPGHGRAMEIDAATTLRVAHNTAWEGYSAITIEMFIRPSELPLNGGRAGLVDKNNTFGFFIQSGGDLLCNAGAVARGQPDGGLLNDAGRYMHVACIGGADGKTKLFARGTLVLEVDGGNVNPTNEELAIAGNSPAGDPFIGAIDGLRIYKRAKTAAEIKQDSLVFVKVDGGDAAVSQ